MLRFVIPYLEDLKAQIRLALSKREEYEAAVNAAGLTATGLKKSEAHLPKYLRQRRFSDAVLRRKPGGGRKSEVSFLFPAVKEFFDDLRRSGEYVDKKDNEVK